MVSLFPPKMIIYIVNTCVRGHVPEDKPALCRSVLCIWVSVSQQCALQNEVHLSNSPFER